MDTDWTADTSVRASRWALKARRRWSGLLDTLRVHIEQTPPLKADSRLAGICDRAEGSMTWVALRLAATDGPVEDEGARLLNIATGRSITAAGYRAALEGPGAEAVATSIANLALLMEVACDQERRLTGAYDHIHDPVVGAIGGIADALFLADLNVSGSEAEMLARVVGALRDGAEALHETTWRDAAVGAQKESLPPWRLLLAQPTLRTRHRLVKRLPSCTPWSA